MADQKQMPAVEIVDISQLQSDPENARKHNPKNIGVIGDLLQEVGAFRSIGIDEQNTVLMGNGVSEAAAERGFTRVAVIEGDGKTLIAVRRRGLSEATKRKAALGDNRASDLSEFDPETLAAFAEQGTDLTWGWTDTEIALITGGGIAKAGKTDPDEAPARRATKITRGDLFTLGGHRLLCGDCTVESDMARLTQAGRAGERPRAPVRRAARRHFQRLHHDPLHLRIGHRPRGPRSGLIQQPVDTIAHEPRPPLADGRRRQAQALRDRLVVAARRTGQHESRPPRQLRRGAGSVGPRFQLHTFVLGQNHGNSRTSQSHAHLLVEQYDGAAPLVSLSSGTGH